MNKMAFHAVGVSVEQMLAPKVIAIALQEIKMRGEKKRQKIAIKN